MDPAEQRGRRAAAGGTEAVAAELGDLDLRATADLVTTLVSESGAVIEAVEAAVPDLTALVDVAIERIAAGGRLVYVGAGSSGLIAALDASELTATFGFDEHRIAVLVAGDDLPAGPRRAAAEDDADRGRRDAEALALSPMDCLVAVSASGATPYVLGVVAQAKSVGTLTGAVISNEGTPLAMRVDHPVELLVGPEPIAGSTRLKSGTGQKLALNAFSTAVMVRIGLTYGNLMAGLHPTNEKLRRRAVSVCMSAASCAREDALAALEASGWDVAAAVVSLVSSIDAAEARRRLEAADGNIRQAVAAR